MNDFGDMSVNTNMKTRTDIKNRLVYRCFRTTFIWLNSRKIFERVIFNNLTVLSTKKQHLEAKRQFVVDKISINEYHAPAEVIVRMACA